MAGRAATLLMIVGGTCLVCARSSPPPAAPAAPPPAPPSAALSPPPAPAPAPNPPSPLNATAPQAIAYAIGLLERQQYAQMLEELTWPEDLQRMKAAGRFETVVARFEGGWGEHLLRKLRVARGRMPRKRADGTLLFETYESGEPLSPMDVPIFMIERDGHWYFTSR
jgi:hypothetical protein